MADYTTPVNQFLKSIDIQPYERYLPNAFNDSLTMLEKVNKMIHQMNESNQLTNEVIDKWNDFVDLANSGQLVDEQKILEMVDIQLMPAFKKEIRDDTTEQLENVSNQLNERVKKVNGKTPDTDGNVIIETSHLAKKEEVRLKTEKLEPESLSERSLALMTGEGEINLLSIPQEGSVGVKETNFLSLSENLFNKNNIGSLGFRISGTTGQTVSMPPYSDSQLPSDWIEIKPNTSYSLTNAQYHAFYNENKNYISGVDASGISPVTSPNNAKFMRVTVRNDLLDKFMLIEGNNLPNTYIPHQIETTKHIAITKYEENINKVIELENETPKLRKGKNLFNKNSDSVKGQYVDGSTGIPWSNPPYSDDYYVFDFIRINEKTQYSKTTLSYYAFYNQNKVYISGVNGGSTNTFTTPANAYYLRMSTKNPELEMLVEGNNLPSTYTPYGYELYALDGGKIVTETPSTPMIQTNPYKDKIFCAFGDSTTEQSVWRDQLKQYLELKTWINKGFSGLCMVQLTGDTYYKSLPKVNEVDIIHVMAGLNDWSQSRSIGLKTDWNDNGDWTGSYYGAVRSMMKKLSIDYPNKLIVFSTPTPGFKKSNTDFWDHANHSWNSENGKKNWAGYTLRDYAEVVIQCGKEFSIPVLDLNYTVGWNEYNYLTYMSNEGTNNLHPNITNGGKVIANRIAGFLKSLNTNNI